MRIFFKTRRLQAWIACFAILLNALAPSISHAVASLQTHGVAEVEVCSINGTHFVALTDEGAQTSGDAPAAPHAQPSHCPFCASHAGSFALPGPGLTPLLAEAGPALVPTLFYHAPRPLFSWLTANPRAPPAAL